MAKNKPMVHGNCYPPNLTGLTITPPTNSGDDFTLTVTSYTREGENDSVAATTETIDVTVNAVADTPSLTVTNASSDEDTAIALNIQTSLNDTDGSESVAIVIGNIPAGATLNKGTALADGKWGLTLAELQGLTITPPVDSSEDFSLTVTSYASESENESVATITETIDVAAYAVVKIAYQFNLNRTARTKNSFKMSHVRACALEYQHVA